MPRGPARLFVPDGVGGPTIFEGSSRREAVFEAKVVKGRTGRLQICRALGSQPQEAGGVLSPHEGLILGRQP